MSFFKKLFRGVRKAVKAVGKGVKNLGKFVGKTLPAIAPIAATLIPGVGGVVAGAVGGISSAIGNVGGVDTNVPQMLPSISNVPVVPRLDDSIINNYLPVSEYDMYKTGMITEKDFNRGNVKNSNSIIAPALLVGLGAFVLFND